MLKVKHKIVTKLLNLAAGQLVIVNCLHDDYWGKYWQFGRVVITSCHYCMDHDLTYYTCLHPTLIS